MFSSAFPATYVRSNSKGQTPRGDTNGTPMGKPRSKVSAAEVVARKKRAKRSDLSSNPFEVRVNRRKHDVLGQKIRSGRGLPGVARSRADQKVTRRSPRPLPTLSPYLRPQRKQTLLQEYRSRGKAGVFQDKRFGEYDRQLSVEEKLAQRFFLEKKASGSCIHLIKLRFPFVLTRSVTGSSVLKTMITRRVLPILVSHLGTWKSLMESS